MTTATAFNVTSEPSTEKFDELFREYYPLVFRTAFTVTGNSEDAKDVAQTIFLRLFRRGVPAGTKNPKGYFYRAAVNTALNVVRSRKRYMFTSDETELDSLVEIDRPAVEMPIEGRLVKAIAQLSPTAVEMLVLRYGHHYSDAEIGKLLDKSRGVVAVTLYRARARLKKLLRDQEEKDR